MVLVRHNEIQAQNRHKIPGLRNLMISLVEYRLETKDRQVTCQCSLTRIDIKEQ